MTSTLAPSSMAMDVGGTQEVVNSDTEDELMISKKVEESSEEGDDGTDSEAKDEIRKDTSSADESEKNMSEPESDDKVMDKPADKVKDTPDDEAKDKPVDKPVPSNKTSGEKKKKIEKQAKPKVSKLSTSVENPDDFYGPLDTSAAEQVKSEDNRRERKQVIRFSIAARDKGEEKAAFSIVAGTGTKLLDIPYVADQIHKRRGADLGYVHRLFFGRKGSAHEAKKNLRQFSGFPFAKDSSEYSKKRVLILKWEMSVLKEMCEILGILKKGAKDEVVDRILEFCVEPTDSGMHSHSKVKGKRSRTSSTSKRSRKSSSSASTSSAKKTSGSSKKSKQKKNDDSDNAEEDNDQTFNNSEDDRDNQKPKKEKKEKKEKPPTPARSRSGPSRQASAGKHYKENEDENEFNEIIIPSVKKLKEKVSHPAPAKGGKHESESESESPAEVDSEEERKNKNRKGKHEKKLAIKPSSTNGKKERVKKNLKFSAPPAKKQKVDDEEDDDEEDDDEDQDERVKKVGKGDSSSGEDSDEQPLSQKKGKIPNDDDLRKAVRRIINGSDLRRVTMKMLLEKVFKEYPDVDLEPKRSFIKSIVKENL